MRRRGDGLKDPLKGRHIVPLGRSRIDRDPDVKRELEPLLSRPITLKEMRRRLVAIFGEKRAPSATSLARYVRRRRLALGFRPGGARVGSDPE